MKTTKDFRSRTSDFGSEDSLKRAAKLNPIKKSGKERHVLYSQIDEEEDMELIRVRKKDSILDYFDDGEDEEEKSFEEDEWEEDEDWEEELDEEEEEEENALEEDLDEGYPSGRK